VASHSGRASDGERDSQDGSRGTAGSLREVGWFERPEDVEEGGVV
jgi:hypothetical protein